MIDIKYLDAIALGLVITAFKHRFKQTSFKSLLAQKKSSEENINIADTNTKTQKKVIL